MHICPSCKEGCLDPHKRCPTCSLPLGAHTLRAGTELKGMLLEGKYELDAFLKEGGMGWVYRGKHIVLGHSVAVKLMKPGKTSDKNRIMRFKREAKAVSLLQHPHIVSITDFGQTAGGQLFIVSEFIPGVTLTEILYETGPLPFSRVLRVFAQVMAAVEEAHGNQVIHRDLKPENIMVTTLRGGEDFVKLLDFGIAKMFGGPPSLNVTVAGEVCGTPSYMAPEQIRGKPPTVQTDVYALGVLIFELLTGHAPFRGSTVEETLSMHLYEPRPSLITESLHGDIPQSVEDVFQRALAVSPRERFQSVSEMRSALFSVTSELPVVAHLPCTACNRPPDSPLGFCSEQCEPKFEAAVGDLRLPAADEPEYLQALEDADVDFLEIDAPVPGSDLFPSLRRSPTSDIPGVVDTGVRLISLADTLSSWDQLQRVSRVEPVHLVGRRQVLSALEVFFEDPVGAMEITGAPGTGRTTVLQAAGRIASARQWRIFKAGADPTFSLSPLYTIRQLLLQVLGLKGGSPTMGELRDHVIARGLTSDDVNALVGLFRPNRALDVEDTLVHYQELMTSAIRAVDTDIEDNGPLCVLLDDATDYDGGSMDFVRRLAEAADGTSLKVIMTLEASILAEHVEQQSLSLAPLNAEEVATLARAASGQDQPLPDELLDRLADRTRGNPFHVRQALLQLPLLDDDAEHGLTLEDLIVRRAGHLSAEARELLDLLSIFGSSAPTRLLLQFEMSPESVARASGELTEFGFLRGSSGEDLLAFQHDVLAKVIHAQLAPERRTELHAQALRILEKDGELLTVRARHAFEGMLGRRALNLLERAGDLSMRCQDHHGAALHHYPRALHVSRYQLGNPVDNPRNLRLAIKLARSLRHCGHLLSAELTLSEASEAAKENPAALALIQLEAGRLAAYKEQPDQAIEAFQDAIRLSLAVGKPDVLMDAYLDLAEAHTQLGNPASALAELEEGLLMVSAGEGTHDSKAPKKFWRLLLGLAEHLGADGQFTRAASMARAALIHAEREGSQRGRALAHRQLGQLGHDNGDQHSTEQNLSTAITLFKRLGDRKSVAECLLLQAQHRPGAEDTLIGQALQLSRQINWTDGIDQALRMVTPEP